MTKKATKPFRTARLQKLKVREITDPAEQAAIDEKIKRAEEAMSAAALQDALHGAATADLVLELCRRLSADERLRVAAELTEQLSVKQRNAFMERLTDRCDVAS